MNVHEFQGATIAVLGAARSGIAVARLLQSAGAKLFVSDQRAPEHLSEATAAFSALGIAFETSGHSDRVFDCSMMVLSPGVPSDAPIVQEALRRKIKVVSELEVASRFCRSTIIAVTGSNGKTTTTTLIGRILGDAKKKHVVAGNIGTAFSSVVLGLAEEETVVLEVSSFQLDHCETFRPDIAILLNITEDHMDRYGHSMERYAASKARIFMNQTARDTLIYSADDPWTQSTIQGAKANLLPFSATSHKTKGAWIEDGIMKLRIGAETLDVVATDQMTIRGVHNSYNAMAAALAGHLVGVGSASIRATLRNFKGVEHRLEFVREMNGIRFYNDSKATNVDSVRYALQAFTNPVILILGGRDKGNDYTQLRDAVRQRVKAIIAIGESAQKVDSAFHDMVRVTRATSMDETVNAAARMAASGDIVLLSPACASFDWFTNYEHRGNVFKDLVNRL